MPRSLRLALVIALVIAPVLASCGEKATGKSPEEVWAKFMEALSVRNMIALPGLATDEFARRVMKAGPADFANLIAADQTARVREVKVVAQDAKTARLEVAYKMSPDDPGQKFIVLLEKPKKNWRVVAIEGDVAMVLPGINF
jgi:hypothetical protein